MAYDVGQQLLNWVAVLSDGAKHRLILMMDLMIAVESRNLVEELMDKHVEKIVSHHHYSYGLYDLPVRRKTLKLQASASERKSYVNVEREYDCLIE